MGGDSAVPTWLSMFNGAVAGVAARTASAPIDLLKIRFQLQATAKQYPSISSALRTVLQHEGPLGFWKGNVAGIYLYATYSAVQFGVYERLCQGLSSTNHYGRGAAGAAAALAGTAISYPFDLIRTRHSLQKSLHRHYGGMVQTVGIVVREEGLRGLYKGIGPSLAQVVPYMGLVFATYNRTRTLLLGRGCTPRRVDLLAGCASGFVSKLVIMPVDVVRKRLQIQGSPYQAYAMHSLPKYAGIVDCVGSIWRLEGPRGFFSGLSLALIKSVPATATTFVVYGLLRSLEGTPPQ